MPSKEKLARTKNAVVDYLARHELVEKLNNAVNELARLRPGDPWMFLGDVLSDLKLHSDTPLVDHISTRTALPLRLSSDSLSHTSDVCAVATLFGRVSSSRPPRELATIKFGTSVLRQYKPKPSIVSSTVTDAESHIDDSSMLLAACLTEDPLSITQNISRILSPALKRYRLHEQRSIDNTLTALYRTQFERMDDTRMRKKHADSDEMSAHRLAVVRPMQVAVFHTSLLVAVSAARFLSLPLHQYVSRYIKSHIAGSTVPMHTPSTAVLPNIGSLLFESRRLPSVFVIPNERLPASKKIEVIHKVFALFSRVCVTTLKGADPTSLEELLNVLVAVNKKLVPPMLAKSSVEDGGDDDDDSSKTDGDEDTDADTVIRGDSVRVEALATESVSFYLSFEGSTMATIDCDSGKYRVVDGRDAIITLMDATEWRAYVLSRVIPPVKSGEVRITYVQDLVLPPPPLSAGIEEDTDVGSGSGLGAGSGKLDDEPICAEAASLGIQLVTGNENLAVSKLGFAAFALNPLSVLTVFEAMELLHTFECRGKGVFNDSFDGIVAGDETVDLAVASGASLLLLPSIASASARDKFDRWLRLAATICGTEQTTKPIPTPLSIDMEADFLP